MNLDGTYGRLSTKLMRKDIFSLLEMMETYRKYEEYKFYVPYLIDEFFYFKVIVDPHLLDSNSKIILIKKCHFFKF